MCWVEEYSGSLGPTVRVWSMKTGDRSPEVTLDEVPHRLLEPGKPDAGAAFSELTVGGIDKDSLLGEGQWWFGLSGLRTRP